MLNGVPINVVARKYSIGLLRATVGKISLVRSSKFDQGFKAVQISNPCPG